MLGPDEMTNRTFQTLLPVHEYNLAATLNSGQAFRWRREQAEWMGVVGSRWVRLSETESAIRAATVESVKEWSWLTDYLQTDVPLSPILASFPVDEPMQTAVTACRGLRLLRQNPWECLASFILSSNKQIVQIRQIVGILCERFGEPVRVPPGCAAAFSFPSAPRLARCPESDLRACRMGFRAPYLKRTATLIAEGAVDLDRVARSETVAAREELLRLPGVGRKIADCVLLFAYGFQDAFPIDVWIMRALRELYFQGRSVRNEQVQRFAASHFGPSAGYAQQYLFHYMRTKNNRILD